MRAPDWSIVFRSGLGRVSLPALSALLLVAAAAQAQQGPSPATPFTQPEFVATDCLACNGKWTLCWPASVPCRSRAST